MKSPTSSVGFIDPDGILNGSTQKERIRKTTTITGKKARAMSTTTGSAWPAERFGRMTFTSTSHSTPVITAASSSTAAKSVNLSSSPMPAMKSTGQATSSRPFLASLRSLPPRDAMASHTMTAKLAAAATMAISSQSNPCCISAVPHLEDGEERFLRNLDVADLLHALLPRFLFLEQLALAADVAAVALGEHVLPQRLDVVARHHVRADGGLDRDVEHLARDQLAHAGHEVAAAEARRLAVHDEGQRVDLVAVDEDVEPHQVARAELADLVV